VSSSVDRGSVSRRLAGAGRGVTKRLVEDLVHGSYELVVDHLPSKDTPRGG
jgi:predicted DNA-binding protein (MmcQ/YjbR family)